MKSLTALFSLCFFTLFLTAQSAGFQDPDVILRKGEEVPKVLLVGSWHFNYPGLDAHNRKKTTK
jgi:hypothetical protein